MPLIVPQHCNADFLHKAAVNKMKNFNRNLKGENYVMVFPDGTKIINIPGTETPFTLKGYKEALGKPFQRITLYICTSEDFHTYCKMFYVMNNMVLRCSMFM